MSQLTFKEGEAISARVGNLRTLVRAFLTSGKLRFPDLTPPVPCSHGFISANLIRYFVQRGSGCGRFEGKMNASHVESRGEDRPVLALAYSTLFPRILVCLET